MDITSFILGRKSGRDSLKTQEKTVTPSESEIVVTPDTGFDALSKVIVEAVEAGGGGKIYYGNISTLTSATGQRVDIDFGFVPDLIVMFVNGMYANTTTGSILYYGLSRKIGEALGGSCGRMRFENSKTYSDNAYSYIDDPLNINTYMSDASATGFYIGKTAVTGNYTYWTIFAVGGLT